MTTQRRSGTSTRTPSRRRVFNQSWLELASENIQSSHRARRNHVHHRSLHRPPSHHGLGRPSRQHQYRSELLLSNYLQHLQGRSNIRTFSETSGNSITLYIFNEQHQTGYQSGQTTDNMFSTSGSTGSFSASVLSPGNYYLVLEHGASFTDQVQNVQVSWVLDGSNLALLGTGLAILATGLVFLFIGYRKMHRASPPPSVTDVVMFDQPGTTSLSK